MLIQTFDDFLLRIEHEISNFDISNLMLKKRYDMYFRHTQYEFYMF